MNDVMTLGHDTQTISFDPTFLYIQSLVFRALSVPILLQRPSLGASFR